MKDFDQFAKRRDSNDGRLTCYNELITQLSSLSLDPCGDVRLSFAKSDFESYGKFAKLIVFAFPQIPYTLISDDTNYVIVMRKDVLLKYFIYSDIASFVLPINYRFVFYVHTDDANLGAPLDIFRISMSSSFYALVSEHVTKFMRSCVY